LPVVVRFEPVVVAAERDHVVGAGFASPGGFDVVEVAAAGGLAAAGEPAGAVARDDVVAQLLRRPVRAVPIVEQVPVDRVDDEAPPLGVFGELAGERGGQRAGRGRAAGRGLHAGRAGWAGR